MKLSLFKIAKQNLVIDYNHSKISYLWIPVSFMILVFAKGLFWAIFKEWILILFYIFALGFGFGDKFVIKNLKLNDDLISNSLIDENFRCKLIYSTAINQNYNYCR